MINRSWIKEHLFAIVSKLPSTRQCVLSMKYPDFELRGFFDHLFIFKMDLVYAMEMKCFKNLLIIEVNKCTVVLRYCR